MNLDLLNLLHTQKIFNNMTEKDLIDLGFQREDSPDESSPFFYYIYELGDFTLITNTSDEAGEDGWYVEIFDYLDFQYKDIQDIKNLLEILQVGLKDK